MWYELLTGTEPELRDAINSAVTLAPLSSAGVPVGGLTLIFSNPALTITFSGAAASLLTPKQVMDQLVAGLSGSSAALRRGVPLQGTYQDYVLSFWNEAGFTLSASGTANAALGITGTPTCRGPATVVGFTKCTVPGSYFALCARS